MKKGVLAVVGASFLYGIMPIFTKQVLLSGLASSALVFNRFFLAALFSFILIKILKIDMTVTKQQLIQLIVIGLIGYGGTAQLLTLAYTLIPVGLATMFHFTNPLFVTLIMIVLFKDNVTVYKVVSCVLAVIGLVLMADFSQMSTLGVIFAVGSGMTYAIYVVSNKKSSFASLDNLVIIFYVSFVNAIFFAIKTLVAGEFSFPPTATGWLYMVITALFCTICSLYLLTYGIKVLGASNASMLNMLEPIVSVFAGIIVYGDNLPLKTALGCAVIVMSGVVVSLDSIKQK